MRRALATFLLVGCGGGASNAPSSPAMPVVPATVLSIISVSLMPAAIQVGQTAAATARGFDQYGAPFAIGAPSWTSSPAGVVTVNADGIVSGAAPGQATLIAAVGGRQGQASIVVVPVPGPGVPVVELLVNPFYGNVIEGQTLQLVATPRDEGGNTLPGRTVSWTSSDSAVATVSGNGLVTALSLGTVIIEVSCEGQHAGAAFTIVGEIDPEIAIDIAAPVENQVVGDTLKVFASIESRFQLTSVVATVGPQQVVMDSIEVGKFSHRIAWVGVLDLSILHFGRYAVTVTGTDSRGHRGLSSAVFERDLKKDGGVGKPPSASKQALPKVPARVP